MRRRTIRIAVLPGLAGLGVVLRLTLLAPQAVLVEVEARRADRVIFLRDGEIARRAPASGEIASVVAMISGGEVTASRP